MSVSRRLLVWGASGDDVARRLAEGLGARLVGHGRELLGRSPDVVFVRLPDSRLASAAVAATVARARAVIWIPVDPTPPPPRWWDRRFLRILLGSQEEARAWVAAGHPLGRLVVIPRDAWAPGALGALAAEAASLGGGRDWRR